MKIDLYAYPHLYTYIHTIIYKHSYMIELDWSAQRPYLVPLLQHVLGMAQTHGDSVAILAVERMVDYNRCLRMSTVEQLQQFKEEIETSAHSHEYLEYFRAQLGNCGDVNEGF